MDFCGDQLLQIQEVLINLIDLMYILLLSWINLSSNVISAHFIDVVFSGVFVQVRIWQDWKVRRGKCPIHWIPSSQQCPGRRHPGSVLELQLHTKSWSLCVLCKHEADAMELCHAHLSSHRHQFAFVRQGCISKTPSFNPRSNRTEI